MKANVNGETRSFSGVSGLKPAAALREHGLALRMPLSIMV
jgi:hypothetical protein